MGACALAFSSTAVNGLTPPDFGGGEERDLLRLATIEQGKISTAAERTFDHGLAGFGLFGKGGAVFRDLKVESLP